MKDVFSSCINKKKHVDQQDYLHESAYNSDKTQACHGQQISGSPSLLHFILALHGVMANNETIDILFWELATTHKSRRLKEKWTLLHFIISRA